MVKHFTANVMYPLYFELTMEQSANTAASSNLDNLILKLLSLEMMNAAFCVNRIKLKIQSPRQRDKESEVRIA